MKKKKLKYNAEKALEIVTTLKANVEALQAKGTDIAFIKALETSIRKTERVGKELIALKERLNTKKSAFELEKEATLELVRNAKEVLKKELGKKLKAEKEPKPDKKQKAEKKIEKGIVEVVEEVLEPK